MQGISALIPVEYRFRQAYPVAKSWGTVATTTLKKQENSESEEGRRVSDEKAEPIVAFSRPPPLPPVLGPLLALSLFDMWSSHDGDDD